MADKFEAELVLDNAAFEGDNRAPAVARILRDLADRIETGATDGSLFDINGNRVGQWWLDPVEDGGEELKW